MCACTPATSDDMLLAPSYPWPRMLDVGMLFSVKNWSIASEIAAPVICCKGVNARNSYRMHMAKCSTLWDATLSARME